MTKRYLVLGFGGIGQALAAQIQARGDTVVVVTRKTAAEVAPYECIELSMLDDHLQDNIPDYVINTIGMLHDENHPPEKSIKQVTSDWFLQSMSTNVIPSIQLFQSLGRVMKRKNEIRILSVSARVGSISDNRLGGWYSYRASKAALNMIIKTTAIEWARAFPQAAIAAYHPGTVDTALSKPFQSHVPPEKLFTPAVAANYLLTMLHKLTPADSGYLFDWQGERVSF